MEKYRSVVGVQFSPGHAIISLPVWMNVLKATQYKPGFLGHLCPTVFTEA